MYSTEKFKLRTSSSIYPFKEKALKTWGLQEAQPNHWEENRIFFGMYHIGDWESFIKTKGKRIVIWAGGDIKNLLRGYAFSDGVDLLKSKRFSWIPWHWIFKFFKSDHYCENVDEQRKLKSLGILASVVPTFLEDVNEFPISYNPSKNPQVYISARKGQDKAYGVNIVKDIAWELPSYIFHIYGVGDYETLNTGAYAPNIIFHGNVPQDQFNEEIRGYQIALRCNESDGFSEITAKGILLGQIVITRQKYPFVHNFETIQELIEILKTAQPIPEARNYYKFNQFPFLQ